ncbi:hypothetical protein J6590_093667, partial [Homalodisca vitripennis]
PPRTNEQGSRCEAQREVQDRRIHTSGNSTRTHYGQDQDQNLQMSYFYYSFRNRSIALRSLTNKAV